MNQMNQMNQKQIQWRPSSAPNAPATSCSQAEQNLNPPGMGFCTRPHSPQSSINVTFLEPPSQEPSAWNGFANSQSIQSPLQKALSPIRRNNYGGGFQAIMP